MTQGERIASLEQQVLFLTTQQKEMNGKLDQLLTLKNKGMGALMLASTIIGTGIVGILAQLFGWWRN